MLISAIEPFTMLDFPEKMACIVFTPGCNFRCGYCHNSEFVLPAKIRQIQDSFIPLPVLKNFLKERQGLLDGVVVTGGEPTLMPDLLDFLALVKDMGFLVKLDTNGNRPDVVERALLDGLVDYIAMDVKTSLMEYPSLVGKWAVAKNIQRSLELIKGSSIDYEFRSTLIKEVHSPQILMSMVELVRGAKKFCLQTFRPGETLSPAFAMYAPFSLAETQEIADMFRDVVAEVIIR